MAGPLDAMTGGLSAAAVRKRQRARKCVVREMEARQQGACAAAEPGGVLASGSRNTGSVFHLIVILPAEKNKNKTSVKCFTTLGSALAIKRLLESAHHNVTTRGDSSPGATITERSPKRLSTPRYRVCDMYCMF